MKRETIRIVFIFMRYISLLLLAIPNLYLFYEVFTPLTIYPVSSLLNLITNTVLVGNTYMLNGFSITIIDACVAGSAYYLLLLLNFSVPMNPKKRILSIAFSLGSFLALNILRIFIFSVLLITSFQFFDITHKLFWYLISAIIVFLIWILTIKIFRIKEIPFYTDLKYLYSLTKPSKSKTKR